MPSPEQGDYIGFRRASANNRARERPSQEHLRPSRVDGSRARGRELCSRPSGNAQGHPADAVRPPAAGRHRARAAEGPRLRPQTHPPPPDPGARRNPRSRTARIRSSSRDLCRDPYGGARDVRADEASDSRSAAFRSRFRGLLRVPAPGLPTCRPARQLHRRLRRLRSGPGGLQPSAVERAAQVCGPTTAGLPPCAPAQHAGPRLRTPPPWACRPATSRRSSRRRSRSTSSSGELDLDVSCPEGAAASAGSVRASAEASGRCELYVDLAALVDAKKGRLIGEADGRCLAGYFGHHYDDDEFNADANSSDRFANHISCNYRARAVILEYLKSTLYRYSGDTFEPADNADALRIRKVFQLQTPPPFPGLNAAPYKGLTKLWQNDEALRQDRLIADSVVASVNEIYALQDRIKKKGSERAPRRRRHCRRRRTGARVSCCARNSRCDRASAPHAYACAYRARRSPRCDSALRARTARSRCGSSSASRQSRVRSCVSWTSACPSNPRRRPASGRSRRPPPLGWRA